jgi:preprotein translocase subunit SecG
LVTFLMILEAIICIALIAVVVLQSGKGGGLAGSIGGGADSVLGGQKKGLDAALSKITMFLGGLFAVITLILVKIMH